MKILFKAQLVFLSLCLPQSLMANEVDDKLFLELSAISKTFRIDIDNAPFLIDSAQNATMYIGGHFASPNYDPLDSHWYFAEMFGSLAESLMQDKSIRRPLIIWAGMASLMQKLNHYILALKFEGEEHNTNRRISEAVRRRLFSNAENVFNQLTELLIRNTSYLNRDYYNSHIDEFREAAARWDGGDKRINQGEYFVLSNSSGWWSSPEAKLSVSNQVLVELGRTSTIGDRKALKRVCLLLLVNFANQLDENLLMQALGYFKSILTDPKVAEKDRAVASYGISLLRTSDDDDIAESVKLLNFFQNEDRSVFPYADLVRRSLNGLSKRRFERNRNAAGELMNLIRMLQIQKIPVGFFYSVIAVGRVCETTILEASGQPSP